MGNLKGKTVIVTGSSRGIGRAIALKCAKEQANVVVIGKTTEKHPKLEGTVHSVAKEVEDLGAKALALGVDVRFEESVAEAVSKVVSCFGGIDVLVNNASAIQLTNTLETEMKRFDLMFGVNVRGTFLCSRLCVPHLKKAPNPHIINLSPPLNIHEKWFKDHVAYTMSKYGMSMCTLGMAAEFRAAGIAVNSVWPQTTIATAAIEFNFPKELLKASRQPLIVADAVYAIIQKNSKEYTGHFTTDEAVLRAEGVTDFTQYAVDPKVPPMQDFFL